MAFTSSDQSCAANVKYTPNFATYYGLQFDRENMSTAGIANGSPFIEMDTSKLYFYDAEGETWREWGADE